MPYISNTLLQLTTHTTHTRIMLSHVWLWRHWRLGNLQRLLLLTARRFPAVAFAIQIQVLHLLHSVVSLLCVLRFPATLHNLVTWAPNLAHSGCLTCWHQASATSQIG
jgi:hypothetical protein